MKKNESMLESGGWITNLDALVGVVREYIAWVDAPHSSPREMGKQALTLLLRLYSAAITLEDVSCNNADKEIGRLSHEQWRRVYERGSSLPFGYYEELFNPHVVPPEQPVTPTWRTI